MSLKSRLAMAKLALHVRAEQADLEFLAPLLQAGVDLLVLGSTGDDERDAEILGGFREVYARLPLLLATDNGGAAEQASADVVHLERPGLRLFGSLPRGHQWTLLGRNARDERTIRKPGDDYAYLFVGPIRDGAESEALADAVEHQRPFSDGALPWFALGEFTLDEVTAVLGAGARRVALGGDVLDRDEDSVAFIAAVKEALDAAWAEDPEGGAYRRRAVAL